MPKWSDQKWKAVQDYCPQIYRKVCLRCSKKYDVVDNIGMFKCTYHPGTYDDEKGWSCCQRKKRRMRQRLYHGFEKVMVFEERHTGCTPCDHDNEDPVDLSQYLDLASYLLQYKETITDNDAYEKPCVLRKHKVTPD